MRRRHASSGIGNGRRWYIVGVGICCMEEGTGGRDERVGGRIC